MLFDDHGRPKSRASIWVPISVFVIALVLASIIIGNRPSPEPAQPEPPIAPEISVVEVKNSTARPVVITTGRVSSPHEINIVSRVSGTIESVSENFRDGASFVKDELLMKIEDHDYRVALDQSRATLANALQLLATEQGLADQAKKEWRELGSAQANSLFLREPQLNSAKAQADAARSAVEQAELNLQRTEIRAPFDGVISNRLADVGQFVSAGSLIAAVQSTQQVQIKVSLTPNQVFDLGWQNRAEVDLSKMNASLSYQTGSTLIADEAQIRHISPLIDPMTQMTEVTLDLISDNNNPKPSPGQFVEVQLQGEALDAAAWLPQSAIYERGQVLLANNNELEIQPVNIVASTTNEILVTGLSDGDLVVTDRPLWVFPGQQVAPVIMDL